MDNRIILAREDLKKTNYLMIALMFISLILILLTLTGNLSVNLTDKHYATLVRSYQNGLSFSLFVFPCIHLICNYFLAKNNSKLIDKYISYHDERKLFIADKVGNNFVFMVEIITMALLSIIAPLYSFDLLLGIIVSISVIVIARGCLYLFYNKRY